MTIMNDCSIRASVAVHDDGIYFSSTHAVNMTSHLDLYTLRMTRFSTNACSAKVKHSLCSRVMMNDHVLQDASLVGARD